MKGRKRDRGRKKALTLLLIFMSSTSEIFGEKKKRPLKAGRSHKGAYDSES